MAGTITFTETKAAGYGIITATCTADAADGSFPATTLPGFVGKLVALRTNPGSPAPTDQYDMTLPDDDGVDRLQGLGANRHTTNSEEKSIIYTGAVGTHPVCVNEKLTLTIVNNSVNSAVTVIRFVYSPV